MIERIHPSILTTTCWLATKFRYVDGIRSRPGVAAVMGTATHESHRRDLRYRVATGELMPDEEVVDSAADAFEREWSGSDLLLTDDEAEKGPKRLKGESKDTVLAMASAAHYKLAPRSVVDRMEDLERRIDLRVSGAPWSLSGYIDAFERSARSVRDTKTRGRKPVPADMEGDIQTSFYAFALLKSGEEVDTIGRDVITRTKTPGVYRMDAPVPTDWSPLLARIQIAGRIFESGSFYPVDPTSQVGKWRCTARFCGYFDRCAFGRARRVSVSITNL